MLNRESRPLVAHFGALKKRIFTSTSISFGVKKSVYEFLILAILLYGAEHWCLTEAIYRKLRVFRARCVRIMCRVNLKHTRIHRISTTDLLNRAGLLAIDVYVVRRQLRWLGHVARMSSNRLPRKMLTCWVDKKRPRGAPDFTYGRGMYKSLKKVNVFKCKWFGKEMCRIEWRKIIHSFS